MGDWVLDTTILQHSMPRHAIFTHSHIRHIMRTYGKNWVFAAKASNQQRASRCDTEWDIRLDISEELPVSDIINRLKDADGDIAFALVSGVERPDVQREHQGCATEGSQWEPLKNKYGSTGDHVHVCLVLYIPKQRSDVLKMVRGPRKLGEEYAAPRNRKFAYAGWVIHHAKPSYKLDGEPDIKYERGTLPMDPFTSEWALKIKGILAKWGSPAMHARFKGYVDLVSKHKIQEQIERLQMQLNDTDA